MVGNGDRDACRAPGSLLGALLAREAGVRPLNSGRPLALFVSPHPDDVCFSLGALVSRLAVEKHLLTVFSRSAWAAPSWRGPRTVDEVSAARTSEDARFCAALGLTYHAFALPDASVRSPGKPRAASGDEGELRLRAEGHLRELARANAFHLLFVPLGLGAHPDHLVSRLAAERVAAETGSGLVFYEDLPYASKQSFLGIERHVKSAIGCPRSTVYGGQVLLAEKLRLAALYESQIDDSLLGAIRSHSERLSRTSAGQARSGTRGAAPHVAERVWEKPLAMFASPSTSAGRLNWSA